jgi:hypothetical protein
MYVCAHVHMYVCVSGVRMYVRMRTRAHE